jgi:hypothetical protein
MNALLTNGQVVTLKKDCECCHHDGPHWLMEDRCWEKKNRQLSTRAWRIYLGYRDEEARRLREKAWQMRKWCVARLLPEGEA